jgi:hypothetical protein
MEAFAEPLGAYLCLYLISIENTYAKNYPILLPYYFFVRLSPTKTYRARQVAHGYELLACQLSHS